MGLLLLIPGLIFLLNQTTWFSGENAVGKWLVIIGGALLAIQVLWFLVVAIIGVGSVRRASRQDSWRDPWRSSL